LQGHVPQCFPALRARLRHLGELVGGVRGQRPGALRILERGGGRDQRGGDDVRDQGVLGERPEGARALAGLLALFLLFLVLGHRRAPLSAGVILFFVTSL